MKNNLQYKKSKANGFDSCYGKIVIDKELTLYYRIIFGGIYFGTTVSDNSQYNGVYYECEDLGETLDEAKGYIDDFVTLVKKNPEAYKDN